METVEASPGTVPDASAERSGNGAGERAMDVLFNITMMGVVAACAFDIGARLARRQWAQALAASEERSMATERRLKRVLAELASVRAGTVPEDGAAPETGEGGSGD